MIAKNQDIYFVGTMSNEAKINLSKNFLTVNGVRAGIRISKGPWVAQCDPDMIKIEPKKGMFPRGVAEAMNVQNDSDMMTDYFARDEIKLFPGDELYSRAAKLAS
ncbi:MAG: hypothetical protein HRU10_09415 [Opitutales bacterium]|nr:hypothetical protein [Opitutales bacterium]